MSITKTSGASNLVMYTASMAVFIEGRESHGKYGRSHVVTYSPGDTAENVALQFRVRDQVMSNDNHGHVLIYGISLGSTTDRPVIVRFYRNVKVFSGSVIWTQPNLCSLVEVSTTDLTITSLAPTAISTVTDNYRAFTIGTEDGTSDRLAGVMMHVNGEAREILTSTANPAQVTVANLTNDPDAVIPDLYNGDLLFSMALGKDSASTMILTGDNIIHMNRNETLTVTVQSEDTTNNHTSVAVSWIEKY